MLWVVRLVFHIGQRQVNSVILALKNTNMRYPDALKFAHE